MLRVASLRVAVGGVFGRRALHEGLIPVGARTTISLAPVLGLPYSLLSGTCVETIPRRQVNSLVSGDRETEQQADGDMAPATRSGQRKGKTTATVVKKTAKTKASKGKVTEEKKVTVRKETTKSPNKKVEKEKIEKVVKKTTKTAKSVAASPKKTKSSKLKEKETKAAKNVKVDKKAKEPIVRENAVIPEYTSPPGLKLVCWNVNGIRALLGRGHQLKRYIEAEKPDVVCFGETKICETEKKNLEMELEGYPHAYWNFAEKKGYAGTAIFSKKEPLDVKYGMGIKKHDTEGRLIALEFDRFWLVHCYVPNAGSDLSRLDYRTKEWDADLREYVQKLEKEKPTIVCGDMNVAYEEIDIHDPKSNRNKSAGFTDAERESFGVLLKQGYVDTWRAQHPDVQKYSYFSYRFNCKAKDKGWRIDYFLVSKKLEKAMVDSFIRREIEGSDHVPIGLILNEDSL